MINRRLVSDLLGYEFYPAVDYWWENHRNSIIKGAAFSCSVSDNGTRGVNSLPSHEDARDSNGNVINKGISTINFVRHKEEPPSVGDYELDYSNVYYVVRMPFMWFFDATRPKYYCYNITFGESIRQNRGLDKSFSPFFKGYVGITGRNPLQRFSEHVRDMLNGKGYVLHSSWRSLLSVIPEAVPTFTLLARAETLDEIYDIEEKYVGQYTLNPKGLNAIPGGKAGLRFMHMLRENGKQLPSIHERDSALTEIENGRSKSSAFYRKGHVRNLPEKCSKRTTWVNPHWVNLGDSVLVN